MKLPIKTAMIGLLLAVLPMSAHAERAVETFTVRISVAGLDLSTDAGAKMAMRRVTKAASKACGPQPMTYMTAIYKAHEKCRKDVIMKAVTALNAPIVTALSEKRGLRG